jgi:hypothetical protein
VLLQLGIALCINKKCWTKNVQFQFFLEVIATTFKFDLNFCNNFLFVCFFFQTLLFVLFKPFGINTQFLF